MRGRMHGRGRIECGDTDSQFHSRLWNGKKPRFALLSCNASSGPMHSGLDQCSVQHSLWSPTYLSTLEDGAGFAQKSSMPATCRIGRAFLRQNRHRGWCIVFLLRMIAWIGDEPYCNFKAADLALRAIWEHLLQISPERLRRAHHDSHRQKCEALRKAGTEHHEG